MSRVVWDQPHLRTVEGGVDRGVFYARKRGLTGSWQTSLLDYYYEDGEPWNGLVSVTRSFGPEPYEPVYYDGQIVNLSPKDKDLTFRLATLSVPRSFRSVLGEESTRPGLYATHQLSQPFGFTYRTRVANGIDGFDHGYKIHIVWNAMLVSTPIDRRSVSSSVTPDIRNLSIKTLNYRDDGVSYSYISLSSRTVSPEAYTTVENFLYGSESQSPTLPAPHWIIDQIR